MAGNSGKSEKSACRDAAPVTGVLSRFYAVDLPFARTAPVWRKFNRKIFKKIHFPLDRLPGVEVVWRHERETCRSRKEKSKGSLLSPFRQGKQNRTTGKQDGHSRSNRSIRISSYRAINHFSGSHAGNPDGRRKHPEFLIGRFPKAMEIATAEMKNPCPGLEGSLPVPETVCRYRHPGGFFISSFQP